MLQYSKRRATHVQTCALTGTGSSLNVCAWAEDQSRTEMYILGGPNCVLVPFAKSTSTRLLVDSHSNSAASCSFFNKSGYVRAFEVAARGVV